MNIRKAKHPDIDRLSTLFNEYRIFYKQKSDMDGAKEFLSERIEKEESEIFVAESNSNLLTGFIQLYPIFSSTRMKRLWLLNDLYVKEDHRGKGISILLINQAKELCKESNASGLILETAKSNKAGNQLYSKTEFILDTEHNYYTWDNE